MRRFTLVAACALVASLETGVLGQGAASASRPDAFTMAIMRADGVMLPFATFDGRRWSTPWPSPGTTSSQPAGLRDVPPAWWGNVPPPMSWTLWPREGEPRQVVVRGVESVLSHCNNAVGLKTSYGHEEPVPGPRVQPYPKVGLVLSRNVPVLPIAAVDRASDTWRRVLEALPPLVERGEQKAVFRFSAPGLKNPATPRRRTSTPFSLERLYLADLDPPLAFYETEKRYSYATAPGMEGCTAITFVTGWLRLRPSEVAGPSDDAYMSACNYAAASFMYPLGVLTFARQVLWVAQYSGWNQEGYAVTEVGDETVRPLVWQPGGSC